jgi:hypothetical protein
MCSAVLTFAVMVAGCGGGDENESGEKEKESERAKTACKAPVTTKPTGLPAAFPAPGELNFTQVRKDGPTIVVDGYWTSGLTEAFTELKDQVEQAGYTILKSEKDPHDAEIAYKTSTRTGQISLADNCEEGETTRVHITNRPA